MSVTASGIRSLATLYNASALKPEAPRPMIRSSFGASVSVVGVSSHRVTVSPAQAPPDRGYALVAGLVLSWIGYGICKPRRRLGSRFPGARLVESACHAALGVTEQQATDTTDDLAACR